MAEIKIEKKKPVWPWIILILIILAAVYFFWYYNDNNEGMDENMTDQDTISQMDEGMIENNTPTDSTTLYSGSYGTVKKEVAMADYLKYIDNEKMGVDHEYTSNALAKLINATEAEAEKLNVDINANLEQARKDAFDITSDPDAMNHADKIKSVATQVSIALNTIQQQKFPSLSAEAKAVKDSANKIETNTAVLQQKETVKGFFNNAGKLLEKMNENEMDKQ